MLKNFVSTRNSLTPYGDVLYVWSLNIMKYWKIIFWNRCYKFILLRLSLYIYIALLYSTHKMPSLIYTKKTKPWYIKKLFILYLSLRAIIILFYKVLLLLYFHYITLLSLYLYTLLLLFLQFYLCYENFGLKSLDSFLILKYLGWPSNKFSTNDKNWKYPIFRKFWNLSQ